MSSPCSTAWAEGSGPANPWSSSPGLQNLSVLGLLRAVPLTTCQGTWVGLRVWFLVKIWFPASSTGSCSDMGPLCWPDGRVRLSLRTPDMSENESSRMCSLQIWYQGLQWKAHHSNLPKDFHYREGLNSGSEDKWNGFTFWGVSTKLILITPAKGKKNFSVILCCQNSSLGSSCLLYFSAKFHNFNVHWSSTISVLSCYHGDFYNNRNFLY